jgi:hypothetical protein
VTGVPTGRVSPFGHPRISGCVPLPSAYRSLPRPSSPPCAQASPTGLLSLDYNSRQARHVHPCRVMLRDARSAPCLTALGRPPIASRCFVAIYNHFPPSLVKQHPPPKRQRQQTRLGRRADWLLRTEIEIVRLCGRATSECFRVSRPRPRDRTRDSGKEVIQPQVPLRLPCYDFAPVTMLAFGRLPPCGLRHGLRALTASMA